MQGPRIEASCEVPMYKNQQSSPAHQSRSSHRMSSFKIQFKARSKSEHFIQTHPGKTNSKLDHIQQWVDQLKRSMDSNLIQMTYNAMESLFIRASSKHETETSRLSMQSIEKQEILSMLEQNFCMQLNLESLYSKIQQVATRIGVWKHPATSDLQTLALESLQSIEKLLGPVGSESQQ